METCDIKGCPAEALVFVIKQPDLHLALCGHDLEVRLVELFRQGFEIFHDLRPQLRLAEDRRN